FLKEIPVEIKNIKNGIKTKNYSKTANAALKIKPILDLLGMDMAVDEVNQIVEWTKLEGKKKDIKEIFKLL
ncbi:MAG TPA: histidine kinase, partial [Flavobacterium sp.]|nr:histidine kinase [Flavobacterium sp.]